MPSFLFFFLISPTNTASFTHAQRHKKHEAVSKVTDTASFFTYTKQNSDFPKPELCHVPDFLYLWT